MLFKKKIDMERIRTTSKMALKISCLAACNNDMVEAERLYGFLAEGISIPDIEPEKPTKIAQVMQSADELFGWIGQHRDDITGGISMIQSMRASKSAAGIPPIPDSL